MTRWFTMALAALSLAPAGPAAAGAPVVQSMASAQVRWSDEAWRFADIRSTLGHDEDNLRAIADHIGALAARSLPAGQRLEVELKDVDLAGEMRWLRHRAQEVRVLRGGVDFPAIELKWALMDGDRVLRQGEDRLTDMAYRSRINRYDRHEPLRYEKRMLDEWFGQAVAAPPK